MKVSQSKAKLFRRCKYAYHLKYVRELRKKRVSRPFQFGKLIHSVIESDFNGDDPFEVLHSMSIDQLKIFAAEKEMYGEILQDVELIMTDYFEYWAQKDPLVPIRFRKKSAEHEIHLDYSRNLTIVIILDGIVRGKNHLRWLLENKTFSKRPTEDDRWRSMQSCLYHKVLEMDSGKVLDGTCWNYVCSKPPVRPELLKSGLISAKKCDTLPSVIKGMMARQNIEDRKALDAAYSNLPRWFYRVYSPVSKQVVNRMFDEFIETCHEIVRDHGNVKAKTIDRHCSWCDYSAICSSELTGTDTKMIERREYEKKKRED